MTLAGRDADVSLKSGEPHVEAEGAVPVDQSVGISSQNLATTVGTLEALVNDPNAFAAVPIDLWKRLLISAGRLSRPNRDEEHQRAKAIRRLRKRTKLELDLAVRAQTKIREERGPLLDREGVLVLPAPRLAGAKLEPPTERELKLPQACYVCKELYTKLHFFYDSICPSCAELNWVKRSPVADLSGRVALITGARIKIGYHTTLMLLRAGAKVIGTTRFPQDAARRYAREPDFEAFKDRLTIYGVDLRNCLGVELLAEHIGEATERLDFLINNAAQTVHRPTEFYAHLQALEGDATLLSPSENSLLLAHHDFRRQLNAAGMPAQLATGPAVTQSQLQPRAGGQASKPRSFSLRWAVPEFSTEEFPLDRFDSDGQQVDLRKMNSWRLKADEVGTPELIEVHLVNAIAPFILVSRLKRLMLRTANRDKHIVNVSAMEGCFSRRTKTERHPHTNMAKASLNMLTRTSARDYVESGIHMNSVDTGWITDEDPHPDQVRKRVDYDFHPPLDAIDGAARVCDPIFVGYQTGEHAWGQFYKDYRPISW